MYTCTLCIHDQVFLEQDPSIIFLYDPPPDVLSPHEATSLQLCMACITPSVAAGFLETFLESSDTHQSFQLLLKALTLHSPTSSSYPSPLEMALQQVFTTVNTYHG